MPIREHLCVTEDCKNAGYIDEQFFHPREDYPPICTGCYQQMERIASSFGVIWTGGLEAKYNDRSIEGGYKDGAHWAVRKRGLDGQPLKAPEPTYIDSWQKQAEYCKAEGLVNPKDLPSKADHSGDEIRSHSGQIQREAAAQTRKQRVEAVRAALKV